MAVAEGYRDRPVRKPPPLDAERLEALALRYVERYATTRAKLADYLRRKLRERGWDGAAPPGPDALADRLAGLGYVDDRAFAEARGASLARRGYGAHRVAQTLRAAGVDAGDGAGAMAHAAAGALAAALVLARRRRIGPYAAAPADRPARARALTLLMRAGHGFDLARRIADAAPGEEIAAEDLGDADD